MTGRFDRQMQLFGEEGQDKIRAAHAVIIGAGGLGSHVVQQLALLGVGYLTVIDSEELSDSNRNRYVTARAADSVPGTRKVDVAKRMVKEIDPSIRVQPIADSVVSLEAFQAVKAADHVFGCLDCEGARLILNELCAAYQKPYWDFASDVGSGDVPAYGGRVSTSLWTQPGCLVCRGLIDMQEAQLDIAGPQAKKDHASMYGVPIEALGRSGPSVVSINGVVASLGVTEFMVTITGLRLPKPVIMYYGHMGRLTIPTDPSGEDCYYCASVRGAGDSADVQRYVNEGIGSYLR